MCSLPTLTYSFSDIFKLVNEINNAYREYKNQLEQCTILNEEMATILSPPREKYVERSFLFKFNQFFTVVMPMYHRYVSHQQRYKFNLYDWLNVIGFFVKRISMIR